MEIVIQIELENGIRYKTLEIKRYEGLLSFVEIGKEPYPTLIGIYEVYKITIEKK